MLDIPGQWVIQGGAAGVLLVAIWLVLTGRIVGTKTVDRFVAAAERRESAWQTAYLKAEEARSLQAQQIAELLDLARTTDAVIRALPRPRGDNL